MGKAKRLKQERELGLRKIKGERWKEITPGMMLVIPKFSAVQRGATPTLVPVHWKRRGHKQAIPKHLAMLPHKMAKKYNQFDRMFDQMMKSQTNMPS